MTQTSPSAGTDPTVAGQSGLLNRWLHFWFAPTNPLGLHAVRVIAGLVLLAWLLPLAGSVADFYGPDGWLDLRRYDEIGRLGDETNRPNIGWSVFYLAGTSAAATVAIYWFCVLAVLLFTLGVWPRLTGILTWVAVLSFTGNPLLEIEAHRLFVLLATYLMFGYVLLGQESRQLTWGSRLFGAMNPIRGDSELAQPSIGPTVAVRLIQIHLAVIIVMSGLHKLQFGDWWQGVAFWYSLNPALQATATSVREYYEQRFEYLTFLSISAYVALAWQILFPMFAWRRLTWVLVPIGALVACVAGPVLYGDPLYGTALLAGSAAFVPVAVWERINARLRQALGRGDRPAPAVEPRKPGRKSDRTEIMAGARSA